jgi:NADH-quinone oxidoreductase subunit J
MIEKLQFYIFAAALIMSALGVVTLLGVALLSVAGLYLLLGAEFLAAVQIIVYIGGILTLIIFAVMFTKDLADKHVRQTNGQMPVAFAISSVIFGVMAYGILKSPLPDRGEAVKIADTASIGRVLFRDYVLAFEVLSIVLLIALAGVIIIAMKEKKK